MMRNALLVFFFLGLLCSASIAMGSAPPSTTGEESIYLENAMDTPLEVTVSSLEVVDAWGRAQSWIGQYSSMKLQISTDYVIQTYNPREAARKYGYYVNKTKIDNNNFKINVQCTTGSLFLSADAEKNAHILAYYIKTGKLYSKFIQQ